MKQELIDLAIKHKFSSKFLYDVAYKYSTKEDLRYLFWMTELQQWLRENYKIIVECSHNFNGFYCKNYKIIEQYNGYPTYTKYFTTYEQALESGLLEVLKLIK